MHRRARRPLRHRAGVRRISAHAVPRRRRAGAVPEDFPYASDTNTEWLDAAGLKALLADGGVSKAARDRLPALRPPDHRGRRHRRGGRGAARRLPDHRPAGRRVRGRVRRDASGARHAVACASGTAALHLAMLALGLGPGEVVHRARRSPSSPPPTAPATSAPRWCSPTSIPTTGLMTPRDAARTRSTRCGGRPARAPCCRCTCAATSPSCRRCAASPRPPARRWSRTPATRWARR